MIRFRGQAQGQVVCPTMEGNRFLGLFGAGDAFVRAGGVQLAQLFTEGGRGSSQPVRFNYFSTSAMNDSIHISESWSVTEGGRINTPAGQFNTIRAERNFQVIGSAWRFTQHIWFDRASNVPVRVEFQHPGNPLWPAANRDWVAVQLQHNPSASR